MTLSQDYVKDKQRFPENRFKLVWDWEKAQV